MQEPMNNNSSKASHIGLNIQLLEQGLEVLETINDETYLRTEPPLYESTIGMHYRHILDHYGCLVRGWNDKIDYDARDRDRGIETDRNSAIQKCRELIGIMENLELSDPRISREVLVKSNINAWSASSIKRELQFLISHTVHHYALIALMLKMNGFVLPDSFGVAPSTLQYRKGRNSDR